jgi:AcrR family transcriptional regulator
MGHREDLLAGGHAGSFLASIGYHYGSVQALLNAAVLAATEEWGVQLTRTITAAVDPAAPFPRRFEQYWAAVLGSFEEYRQVWAATFDLYAVAGHVPEVRDQIAAGLQDGRLAWARLLHGIDPETEPAKAQAVGSLHQALLSGILAQWLTDPARAPSAHDLLTGLQAIAGDMAGQQAAYPR